VYGAPAAFSLSHHGRPMTLTHARRGQVVIIPTCFVDIFYLGHLCPPFFISFLFFKGRIRLKKILAEFISIYCMAYLFILRF
jgi:hypothetical protein